MLSSTTGPRNTYTPRSGAPSLVALVAVSLARSDREDPRDRIPPYAARIQLPPGELIDLATYERLMNVLVLVYFGAVHTTTMLLTNAHRSARSQLPDLSARPPLRCGQR